MIDIEYTNSQINAVIDEYVHREIDRQILKRRFIDGITFEKLAEEFDLTPRHVKTIVYKYEMKILKYL